VGTVRLLNELYSQFDTLIEAHNANLARGGGGSMINVPAGLSPHERRKSGYLRQRKPGASSPRSRPPRLHKCETIGTHLIYHRLVDNDYTYMLYTGKF
jgi:hypothetical protein